MITGKGAILPKKIALRAATRFIETEAGVDEDANADEDDDNGADLDGFIVADDVY